MAENTEPVQKTVAEEFEEKKEHMLNELFQSPLKVWDDTKKVVNTVKVGDVITKKDVWFSKDKPRPIINEEGFDKLVKATGAQFPRTDYIEKQSDYRSVLQGQVVVEATVVFPNDEMNKDLGVANALNCKPDISKANMPIMAMKRAKSRAFFRSSFVNMTVFDESEVSDELSKLFKETEAKNTALEKEVDKLNKQIISMRKKSTDFFEDVKQNTLYRGNSIWAMDNFDKAKKFLEKNKEKLNPLELKLFTIRFNELEQEEKEKKLVKEQEEIKKAVEEENIKPEQSSETKK
jgi:hypothetical protein